MRSTFKRCAAAVGVASCLAITVPIGAAAAATSSNVGTYQVVGNKIVETDGQQFVPYGFVTFCLAERNPDCNATTSDPVTDAVKIRDAATYWHANVVRIQVAEQNLVPNGTVNQSIMNKLSDQVRLANSLGMVAIVTDQEEQYEGPPLPTASAVPFWNAVANTFKSNPRVFFDLYNEPRITTPTSSDVDSSWNIWRNGGTDPASGTTDQFVGMQSLVNDIRQDGARNIIVAEGLKADKDLSGIPQYALTGTNIAYGMEPDLTAKDDTPAQWASNWGNLAKSVPIMMEAFQDWPGTNTCYANSPSVLPQLLSYLKSKNLGLISWALDPGVMMIGDNPEDPTSYNGAKSQTCDASNGKASAPAAVTPGLTGKAARKAARQAEKKASRGKNKLESPNSLQSNTNGPGATILAFFRANSHPATAVEQPATPTTSSRSSNTWLLIVVVILLLLVLLAFVVRLCRWRPRSAHR
jgi:hypothetical protein